MLNAENIFLFSVQMLLGISLLLLVLTAYLWYITKDKTIGIYAVYVLACLCCAAVKLVNIATGNIQANIMENTLSDELVTTLAGLVYIYFFGWVFEFNKGSRWRKVVWKAGLTVMIFQIIYLLYIPLKGDTNYFNPVITPFILAAISLIALVFLVFAFTTKNKSGFQKIILAGGVVFYVLILAGNLAEYFFKTGSSGFNMSFFALIVENIFFAIASANRFKSSYVESEKIKIRSFQQQLETEQVINYFTASISDKNNIDDLMWDVAKNCIAKLGFEDCVIYLADDEQKILAQKAAWGPKTKEENKIANPLKIPFGTGIVGHVALNDKAEIIPDTALDKRYITDDASRPSEISVPISYNGKVLGVIDSEHSQKNFYTERHLHLLTTIATLLAERIIKIRAEQSAKEKEIEVLTLRAINYQYQLEIEQVTHFFSQTISQKETVDEMLWDVSKNLIGKLGFEDCMIYLWNDEKTMLLQKAGYGPKGAMFSEADKNKYHVPKGKGLVGAAAATKQNLLVNDTSQDSRYFTADEKIRLSELCVPIIRHDEVLGVINAEHSQKDFYTQRHLQILTTVASLLAEKIEKIKAEQQTYEAEVQLLKLNKDLATSQLTALRAQMNPHFIFNALNSVQQYILQGNVTEANKYLSKFSKLQREILNYSSQNFIPLQKEIETLLLYLELEQLRFAENFTFTIAKDEQIDEEEIKIPPMIIQPFIENAIWHGLMPKTGERFVKVNFSLHSDEELICTITDNGIGREAASRLQQSNGNKTGHKSKGMSLVHDRLNILQAQYGKPFSASISDLVNEEGVAMGTQVELTIHLDF